MGYREWPATLLTGAALAAAGVVAAEHVVDARDGCLGSAGWFTAYPVALAGAPDPAGIGGKSAVEPGTTDFGATGSADEVGTSSQRQEVGDNQISGCLDLDRIEVPAPLPAPDGRA